MDFAVMDMIVLPKNAKYCIKPYVVQMIYNVV